MVVLMLLRERALLFYTLICFIYMTVVGRTDVVPVRRVGTFNKQDMCEKCGDPGKLDLEKFYFTASECRAKNKCVNVILGHRSSRVDTSITPSSSCDLLKNGLSSPLPTVTEAGVGCGMGCVGVVGGVLEAEFGALGGHPARAV
uniref:Uncharacterized protein n=1 Tax=Knipowitschia caucasica TaxID=637954 RepID=A0AAV2KCP7_KNICA